MIYRDHALRRGVPSRYSLFSQVKGERRFRILLEGGEQTDEWECGAAAEQEERQEEYRLLVDEIEPKHNIVKNCFLLFGRGSICLIGQLFLTFF